jgi:UDP-N-acetylglucosamine acyltransferase
MSSANTVHPTAVIGPGVTLGVGNVVAPYAVILGPCRIGDRNWIGPHVTIGTPAQIRDHDHPAGWVHEPDGSGVVIGDDNVIREYVTVHQPAEDVTRIGARCYLMSYAHVPHDATIGDGVTLSNSAQIGGHTVIGDNANIGLSAVVHQRLAIGGGAMIGMGAVVTKDVPPFAVVYGNPARVAGTNRVGLQRAGFGDGVIAAVTRLNDTAQAATPPTECPPELQAIYDAHHAAVGRRG